MSILPTTEFADGRYPVAYLNYHGDQRQILEQGPLGPTMFKEYVWPVEAVYDSKTKMTRVGFSYVAPVAPVRNNN